MEPGNIVAGTGRVSRPRVRKGPEAWLDRRGHRFEPVRGVSGVPLVEASGGALDVFPAQQGRNRCHALRDVGNRRVRDLPERPEAWQERVPCMRLP